MSFVRRGCLLYLLNVLWRPSSPAPRTLQSPHAWQLRMNVRTQDSGENRGWLFRDEQGKKKFARLTERLTETFALRKVGGGGHLSPRQGSPYCTIVGKILESTTVSCVLARAHRFTLQGGPTLTERDHCSNEMRRLETSSGCPRCPRKSCGAHASSSTFFGKTFLHGYER